MAEIRIGVIGAGAMGRNHVRVLAALEAGGPAEAGGNGVELVGVADRDPNALAAALERAGRADIPTFASYEELVPDCDALVVAVPTSRHEEIGRELLAAGKHVLMEKPIAPDLDAADRLLEAAHRADRVLAVGHVEFHNPAVSALLAAARGARFVEVQRLGVFSPRSLDVDVVLDLMIHDLQILHALDPSPLAEVRATGIQVLSPRVDIANVRLELESGCTANLTASRVSSERIRKLRVFLPERYYSLDYVDQEVKGYRLTEDASGKHILPDDLPVEGEEPLRRELVAFLAACRGDEDAGHVTGAQGRQALATALAVMEAIEG